MKLVKLNGVCACEATGPVTEFRLFKAGPNETSKGTFVFDEVAAQSVMAAYAKAGTDIMIDLEHLSLNSKAPNYNPDAQGWAKLELRGGELWCVGVKWTSSGEWRLRDKLSRYVSPAFASDDANRVTELVNVALVAMPATYDAQELIAASRRVKLSTENSMDPKLIKEAFDALIAGDAEKCAELLKSILTTAITGEAPAEAATPADSTDAAPAVDASKVAASADTAAANTVLSKLLQLTGSVDADGALEAVETWKAAQEQVAKDKANLELASRRMLIAELVKLGVETPATAWQGEPNDRVPVARLSTEPLADMRERVKQLSAAKGKKPVQLTPAASDSQVAELSSAERELIKARGISEKEFLSRKREMLARCTVNHKQIEATQ